MQYMLAIVTPMGVGAGMLGILEVVCLNGGLVSDRAYQTLEVNWTCKLEVELRKRDICSAPSPLCQPSSETNIGTLLASNGRLVGFIITK